MRERPATLRFDDRLATVLAQSAVDHRGRAVQWRQLVELIARGTEISPALRDIALDRVAQLMQDLPDNLLAATARAIAGRSVPVELVALFAARGAFTSAALLAEAVLDSAGWQAVRAVAARDVLPLLTALHPGAGITSPVKVVERARIDAQTAEHSILPAGLFRWETGPTGEIDWVEGAPRAGLIGRCVGNSFANPFIARLPFADEPLIMAEEGVLSGEWRWSGAPAFYPESGRFAGYRGVARREGAAPETESAIVAFEVDDGLRELMHELRTPLNAIIGFGEIIEGQYLGPAHRGYRDRAAVIVRQARRLADAVDNLDLAARLRSGRAGDDSDAGPEVLAGALAKLRVEADERQLHLLVEHRSGAARTALQPLLAERLLYQFGSAMLEPAVAGERIVLAIDRIDSDLAIGIDRPAALYDLSEQRLLADRGQGGMRFALRLIRGIAEMVGGRLEIGPERLVLLLPLSR